MADERIISMPVDQIQSNPLQPRGVITPESLVDLVDSIREHGILEPLVIAKTPAGYQLIAGERRVRACQLAGLDQIPALIDQREDQTGETTLAMQLVENLQRTDLSPLERAQAIGVLRETYNLSIRDIGDKLGVSKSMVQRSLEILELPDDLLNALKEGASESKILLLAKVKDEEVRAAYLKDLDVLTRSQIKKDLDHGAGKDPETLSIAPEDARICEEIQRALGLKVRLSRSASNPQAGRLSVEFYSNSDLQEIFRKLVQEGA